MAKGLNFFLTLSLKEIALRRVTVLLSNDCEIPGRYCNPDSDWNGASWESWRNTHKEKVKYKISKLLLPESLRKEIIDKVRPLSLELGKWAKNHKWIVISAREIGLAIFYWTSAGTIDYKKTAEAFLGYEVSNVERRYVLACRYCLADYIPLLWEALAEYWKEFFLGGISVSPCLEYCWPHILKGDFCYLDCLWRGSDRNLTSFNQWAFENSAKEGNKMAAEYFFLKLTHEEREVSVMRTTLYVLSRDPTWDFYGSCYDVLCYLLSLMTPEQQMEAIKEKPVRVLLYFCVMIWQDLLLENASVIWPFLPTSDYDELSVEILTIVVLDYYPKSFREFFITSPLEFKKNFVYHKYGEYRNHVYRFLDEFFHREDSDSIECIFRNVDVRDRVAIVFNRYFLCPFYNRDVQETSRRMGKVCLREARLSKEDRERLKKERPDLRRVIEEL